MEYTLVDFFYDDIHLKIPEPESIKNAYNKALAENKNIPFPYWSKLWPASEALAQFITQNPNYFYNKKVAELGAGLALPSFVAAPFASSIEASDYVPDAIELMKADGSTVVWDEKNPEFYGAVVNIGALGIVTRMALAIQPTYQVTQEVYENLPMNALEKHFDDIYSAGYSVSMFTHWLDRTINQVWVKKKVGEQYPTTHFHGATPAKTNLHPIKVNSPVNCTDQMGVPGPWYERLPHFKMGFTPSNGAELQTEFFIPRKYAYQAIMAVESLHEVISPVLFVTEIRSIAADAFWLSPAYKQDVIAIHFTWKQEVDKVMQVIPQVEAKLKPFGAMPHWGKIFTMPAAELQSRYPKFKDFRALAKKMDPKGVWKNEFLERNLYT